MDQEREHALIPQQHSHDTAHPYYDEEAPWRTFEVAVEAYALVQQMREALAVVATESESTKPSAAARWLPAAPPAP